MWPNQAGKQHNIMWVALLLTKIMWQIKFKITVFALWRLDNVMLIRNFLPFYNKGRKSENSQKKLC